MGNVLEMSLGTQARLAIAALLLAGCTSGDFASTNPADGSPMLARLFGTETVVPAAASPPTAGAPAIRVTIDHNRAVATMVLATQRNGYQTWVAADRRTVTLRGDVVSATRGLLIDLLAAETDITAAALKARRETPAYQRTYRYTDDTRGILSVTYDCKMSRGDARTVEIDGRVHPIIRMIEHCTGPTGVVRNDFFVGGNGVVLRSRQYLNPDVGYITIDRLTR
jgi:hypothetical protein